jgi:ATP-dependent metalloprotease FtsH
MFSKLIRCFPNPPYIYLSRSKSSELPGLLGSILVSSIGIYISYSILSKQTQILPKISPDFFIDYKVSPDSKRATFNDVRGISEVRSELQDVVDMLKNRDKYFNIGAKLPRGILLTGEPGTGKTLLARAIAGEADVTFFSASGSDFDEVFVGVGAGRIRGLFKEAKKLAPSIIFIDEIDTLGAARMQDGNIEKQQATLNQLLVEMDGFEDHENVLIIAATNVVSDMDPALLRAGRFDKEISVPVPHLADRIEIFKYYLEKVVSDPEIDIEQVAKSTTGFTGADIANMVNTALLQAIKDGRHACIDKDLESARDRILLGIASPDTYRSENRKKKIALREASKAVSILFLQKDQTLDKVSIIKRGQKQGKTSTLPSKDEISISISQVFTTVQVALSSTACEDIFFKKQKNTDYRGNELRSVSGFIRQNLMHGLLEDKTGLLFFDKFKDMSLKRQNFIDKVTEEVLETCYQDICKFIRANKEMIEAVAEELVEKETLNRNQITEIANRFSG